MMLLLTMRMVMMVMLARGDDVGRYSGEGADAFEDDGGMALLHKSPGAI
jgi:hypothetical protein